MNGDDFKPRPVPAGDIKGNGHGRYDDAKAKAMWDAANAAAKRTVPASQI
jgi:hypothetical protein